MLTVTGTGHRPHKLGGYGKDVCERLVKFAVAKLTGVLNARLPETPGVTVVSGMALGWDQALAEAVLALKKSGERVRLCCAVPCDGQENVWPAEARERYGKILAGADRVMTVTPGPYTPGCMRARNAWMVGQLTGPGDFLLALWDGSPGGTAGCVRLAVAQGKRVVNVWDSWQEGYGT